MSRVTRLECEACARVIIEDSEGWIHVRMEVSSGATLDVLEGDFCNICAPGVVDDFAGVADKRNIPGKNVSGVPVVGKARKPA